MLCSIKTDTALKKFLANTIGNSLVFSIMAVLMSTLLSPYLAGKLTAFKFGGLQSLKRSQYQVKIGNTIFVGLYCVEILIRTRIQVSFILVIQTCIDLGSAFAMFLIEESCLRFESMPMFAKAESAYRYYIKFVGGLETLVHSQCRCSFIICARGPCRS